MRLIDADEAIQQIIRREKYLMDLNPLYKTDDDILISIRAMKTFIMNRETVDPAYHGHWLHECADGDPTWDICCFCGFAHFHVGGKYKNIYCSGCGARMEDV